MKALRSRLLLLTPALLSGLVLLSGEISASKGADNLEFQKVSGPQRYGSVLDLGQAGHFDEDLVASPKVLFDGATYRMWYSAMDFPPHPGGIGLATSSDGINWTRANDGNPVLNFGAPGKFDSAQLIGPEVLYDRRDGLFKMWYGGMDATPGGHPYYERIGMATSPDGINWTRQNDGNPVLDAGTREYDNRQAAHPCVLQEGSGFRMWYSAYSLAKGHTICTAVSPDGITWTRENNGSPVTGLSANQHTGPSVIKQNGEYLMFVSGVQAPDVQWAYQIYGATSVDGRAWQMLNDGDAVLSPGSGDVFDNAQLAHPSILLQDDVLKVWYMGYRTPPGSSQKETERIGLAQQGSAAHAATKPSTHAATKPVVAAVDYQRTTVYESPQKPRYTCWVNSWLMPDGQVMLCFTQATESSEGRSAAPKAVQEKLSWPPRGPLNYDMTGLDLRTIYLRSSDEGTTWKKVSEDPFISPMNNAISHKGHLALADGTILRNVWGHYLPYNPELPKTGFLQRSADGTTTWGPPEVFLDPKRYTTWPVRLRKLRDGRLLLLGGVAEAPAWSMTRRQYQALGMLIPLLMVSEDEGKSWTHLPAIPTEECEKWSGEEYDLAELPSGNLLCMFRRYDPDNTRRECRWQGLLKKEGDSWVCVKERFGRSAFPHTGHPELLATREGVVLHLTPSKNSYTADAGQTWNRLNIPGTCYYPSAVQTPNGTILVFSHCGGGDSAYGVRDLSIVMDRFRLRVKGSGP